MTISRGDLALLCAAFSDGGLSRHVQRLAERWFNLVGLNPRVIGGAGRSYLSNETQRALQQWLEARLANHDVTNIEDAGSCGAGRGLSMADQHTLIGYLAAPIPPAEHALITYLRGLGATAIWPNEAAVGGVSPDVADGYDLAVEATVTWPTAGQLPGLAGYARLNEMPAATGRLYRTVYDAGLWTLPYSLVAVFRADFDTTDSVIISRTRLAAANRQYYAQVPTSGAAQSYSVDNAGGAAVNGHILQDYRDALWHVFCVTISSPAANNVNDSWIDGGDARSANTANPPRNDGITPIQLGVMFNTLLTNWTRYLRGGLSVAAAIPNHTLTLAEVAQMYALFGGTSAGVKAGRTGVAPDTLHSSDTFEAANGTNINGFVPAYSRAGNSWVSANGAWDIQGNRANTAGAGPGGPDWVATLTQGLSNYAVEGVVNVPANGQGDVVVRYDAAGGSTFYTARIDDAANNFTIQEWTGAAWQQRAVAAVAIAPATDYLVRIECNGQALTATLNGANQITYNTAATNQTSAIVGMRADTAATRIDHWKVEAL